MECMQLNLYQLMRQRQGQLFDASTVKSILYQILLAIRHIHQSGYFHRDIKPENLLVSSLDNKPEHLLVPSLDCGKKTPNRFLVKVADFGLARHHSSQPPYTGYVSTRWYRAPEVLLRANNYGWPLDIWAFGTVAIEVSTLRPMFPGGNELEQLSMIRHALGSPSARWVGMSGSGGEWRDGINLAAKVQYEFHSTNRPSDWTVRLLRTDQADLMDLAICILKWDPSKRPSAERCLAHPCFKGAQRLLPYTDDQTSEAEVSALRQSIARQVDMEHRYHLRKQYRYRNMHMQAAYGARGRITA